MLQSSFSRGGITVSTSSAKAVFVISNLPFVHPLTNLLYFKYFAQHVFRTDFQSTFAKYFCDLPSQLLLFSLFIVYFSCIPIIVMPCLCLCLIFDCFLHLSVYLRWTFPSVTTSFARILARGIVEFISEQFQFPFCSFCCIALSLYVFLSAFFYLSTVCCAEIQHLYLSLFEPVCLWLQTQLYYRCSLKVTSSVHNSSGIFRILEPIYFQRKCLAVYPEMPEFIL